MFDPNNSVNVAHGVTAVWEKYGDLLSTATPAEIGVVDCGVNPEIPGYKRTLCNPKFVGTGYTGHATTCGKFAGQFLGNPVNIVDMRGAPATAPYMTPFDIADAINVAIAPEYFKWGDGVNIVSVSWSDGGGPGLQVLAKSAHFAGINIVGPLRTKWDQPVAHTINRSEQNMNMTCIGAFPVANGRIRGEYSPDVAGVAIIATTESWAVALLSGAIAMLKTLKPTLSASEAVTLILDSADLRTFGEYTNVRFLRIDKAVEMMLGDTIPTPEPTPDPVYPKTMTVYYSDNTNKVFTLNSPSTN